MTKGFRIRNYDGSIALDSTMPMSMTLGTLTTGTVNGSFVIPDVGLTQYFAYITGIASPASKEDVYGAATPYIAINGRTISWTFPDMPSVTTKPSMIITYGGYSV